MMVTKEPQKTKFGASNPALTLEHEPWGRGVLMWGVGVVVAVFFLYLGIGVLSNFVARQISDKQESRWFAGKKVLNLTGFEVSDGSGVVEFSRCKELLGKLKTNNGLRQLPYNIYLANNKTPNAFAVPGGHIVVTQGLLELVKSDLGLAMVLAHELGHHQYRDPLRGMGQSLSLSLIVSLFMGGQSTFIRLVTDLVSSSYSREQELRADRFGYGLVSSTFHRTAGAFEFFEKVSEHQTGRLHELASMLSTHPYALDRIKALKDLEAEIQRQKKLTP
jgi:Zn-dependent protease with chaperone function